MSSNGWIGVDLDGTLAHYESFGDGGIGAPIKPMIRRIKHYLKKGRDVRILTARVAEGGENSSDGMAQLVLIARFCIEQFGQALPITCSKDRHMYMLIDDRAMQVIPNKGILVREELRRAVRSLRDIEVDPTDAYLKAAAALSKLDEWSLKLASAE